MKKTFLPVAIALVGLGATMTSCSKPTLEEQIDGSYSVTNFDQSATIMGFPVTITDNVIDPSTNIGMVLGEAGGTNPLSGTLNLTVLISAFGNSEADTINETLSGSWYAKEAGDTGLDSLIWVDADGMKTRFGIQSWDKQTLVLKGSMTEVDPDLGPITLNQDITLVKK
jgi:hypothetical protein